MQKKDIIELSITGVFILVLLFLVSNAVRGRKQTRPLETGLAPKRLSQETAPLKEPTSDDREFLRKLDEESKSLSLKRDPFVAKSIPSADEPSFGLHLSGIAWDKESPKVIINDIILGIGDSVGGKTIIEITQDKVILSDGIRNFEIRLGQ